jgi:hypothetical protein
LIGVPHSSGREAILLYLGAFGSFGKAFGVFDDLVAVDESLSGWSPSGVQSHPVFVDDEHIQEGRWSIKARRPDLVDKFQSPELFHDPQFDPGDGSYGPYGLAESPSGELRKLDSMEAETIFGAVPGGFRQAFSGDEMEAYLRKLLPRAARH